MSTRGHGTRRLPSPQPGRHTRVCLADGRTRSHHVHAIHVSPTHPGKHLFTWPLTPAVSPTLPGTLPCASVESFLGKCHCKAQSGWSRQLLGPILCLRPRYPGSLLHPPICGGPHFPQEEIASQRGSMPYPQITPPKQACLTPETGECFLELLRFTLFVMLGPGC